MQVWLVGSGIMAIAYAAVLKELPLQLTVIGRGAASAAAFAQSTGLPVVQGGVEQALSSASEPPAAAIVAVGVEALFETTRALIVAGVRSILIEKPGALYQAQLLDLRELANRHGADVRIGYNRRHFASTAKALAMAEADGGFTSCTFEFTEWGHEIETLVKGEGVKERWLLSNSSHVIDLAFFLIGRPQELHTQVSGELNWHPSGSRFVGSGVSTSGIPFSYHANWDAPGRWGIELLSRSYRYIFRPMEALHIMRRGSVAIEPMPLDNDLDLKFKPGLMLQTRDFLEGRRQQICSLDEQLLVWNDYCRMAGYHP